MALNAKRKASEVNFDGVPGVAPDGYRPQSKKRGASLFGRDQPPNGVLQEQVNGNGFSNGQHQQQHQNQPVLQKNLNGSHQPFQPPPAPENTGSNGFVPTQLVHDLSTPSFQSFQLTLTTFCHKYGHIFGPPYASDLKAAHWKIMSSSSLELVREAGTEFISTLSRYISDLQQVAVGQIQLRVRIVEVGVAKEAVEAVDGVLGRLDEHIIGLGAEVEGLVGEMGRLGVQ